MSEQGEPEIDEPMLVHVYPEGCGHITEGTGCWCRPRLECGLCESQAPCIHGSDRPTVVVHKEES